MKTALLDLNVLTALLWPDHEHHAPAQAWFKNRGKHPWATCPITQLGFIRLVTNPAFSREAISTTNALELLSGNLAHERHEFWSERLAVTTAIGDLGARVQGYRQLTDAYLLSLAKQHKGTLATFDSGIRSLAGSEFAASLEIIPTA